MKMQKLPWKVEKYDIELNSYFFRQFEISLILLIMMHEPNLFLLFYVILFYLLNYQKVNVKMSL